MAMLRTFPTRGAIARPARSAADVVVFLGAAALLWLLVRLAHGADVPWTPATAPASISTNPCRDSLLRRVSYRRGWQALPGLARTLGGPAAPQLIAAGTVAGATLFLGAALFNTLTLPALADQPALGAVVYHLGYLIGGPAHVVALAILIGTTAIAGRLPGRLPRWLSIAGLVIAGIGLLAVLNFATPPVPAAWVMPFIPGGRFPGYLFIVAAAVALRRPPALSPAASATPLPN